ncbi:MAG: hypothetical protein K2M30_05375 [Desulfovibrionaceae bacterium]|nr:hypothetical protein [Desulfovibrionaceae bacterium]
MAIAKYRQNSFNAGVISPLLYTRITQEQYRNSCIELHNMLLYPQGGVYRRAGFQYLGKVKGASRLLPFVYNIEETYILEFSENLLRIWYNGELVRNRENKVIEIESPYTYNALYTIRYAQTTDKMYFTSPHVRPYVLKRSDYDSWSFSPLLFGATHKPPKDIKCSGGKITGKQYRIRIRSLDEKGRESIDSEEIISSREASMEYPMVYTWDANGNPSSTPYYIYIKGPDDDYFKLKGTSISPSFKDYGIAMNLMHKSSRVLGPYNGEGNYPIGVAMWQQRLIFAGSLLEPQTLWFSKIGEYDNFFDTKELPDDDPITFTIASATVEPVQWIYVHRDRLFVGTALGEWSVSSYDGNSLTPRSVSVSKHTSYGTSPLQPLHVGDAMVFVQKDKKVLRQLQYIMEYDSFIGKDLSILAEHITHGTTIRELVWQQYPQPVLWILLDNGSLAGLTYIQEYEIFAWHTHSTQGTIESIVSVPTEEESSVYIVVKRVINGKEVQYMEKLHNTYIFEDIKDGRFLDSFTLYRGEETTKIDNLSHLEGKEVYVLADGMIEEPLKVANGAIELRKPVSYACVGLSYVSKMNPALSLLPKAEGKDSIIYAVVKVSVTSTNKTPFYVTNGFDDIEYPSSFSTCEKEKQNIYTYVVTMPPQHSREYNIVLKQYMPIQMVITSVSAEFGG